MLFHVTVKSTDVVEVEARTAEAAEAQVESLGTGEFRSVEYESEVTAVTEAKES